MMAIKGKERPVQQAPVAKALAFAPDGKALAVTGKAGLTLYEVATGKNLAAFDFGVTETHYVTAAAFSRDARMAVVGFSDGVADVWDLTALWADATAPAKPVTTLEHFKGPDSVFFQVWAVAFSPDGKAIATGNPHGTIKVWDVVKGK
jgi:WD40 repeat protein